MDEMLPMKVSLIEVLDKISWLLDKYCLINFWLGRRNNMDKEKRDKILGVIIALLYCIGLPVLFFINAKVGTVVLAIVTAILIIGAFTARKAS